MATQKQETAEQKLLKMIEANKTSGASAAGSSTTKFVAGKPAGQKHSFLSALKFANKILILVLIFSVLFFAYEIKSGIAYINREINISLDGDVNISKTLNARLPIMQKLSFYSSAIKKRNIFQPYEESVKGETTNTNRRAADQAKDFRLVGIAWLDSVDSASVMIEDKNKNVTYFLQKGEKVGNINVKTIYADSVLLGYENEEIIIQYDKPKL